MYRQFLSPVVTFLKKHKILTDLPTGFVGWGVYSYSLGLAVNVSIFAAKPREYMSHLMKLVGRLAKIHVVKHHCWKKEPSPHPNLKNDERKHRTEVFVMVVTEELPEWEDSRSIGRQRKWFTVEDALKQLSLHKPVQLTYLESLISPNDTSKVT